MKDNNKFANDAVKWLMHIPGEPWLKTNTFPIYTDYWVRKPKTKAKIKKAIAKSARMNGKDFILY